MRNSESSRCGKILTFGMETRLPGQLNFHLYFSRFATVSSALQFENKYEAKVAATKSQVSDSEENRNKNWAANVKVSLTLRNSGSESNYFIFIKNIIALNSPYRLIFIASKWIRCCSNFHEIAFAALSAVHKSNCNSTLTCKSLQPFSSLYNSPPRSRPSSHPSEAIKIMISTFCLALHVLVQSFRTECVVVAWFTSSPLHSSRGH